MNCSYINQLIVIHQDNLASYKRRARLLIFGGSSLLLFALLIWLLSILKKLDINLLPSLVSIIGIFVTICSVLQSKEITPGRIKLARCEELRRECERMKDLPEDERRERIREINKGLGELE
ncbi:MAG: hypothetical protein QOH41_208 [Blastocatellia bacterium]|jgi:hypothetical protein|nr:hypothetical protein [Blastocatellia bacterium]